MPNLVGLAGKTFGRWTVLRRGEGPIRLGAHWVCRCECGSEKTVRGNTLTVGKSRSCGCLNADVQRAKCVTRNRTHGLSKTRTYDTWANMVQRCTNPKASGWLKYGARGIRVCERWTAFENFYADMGECPAGLTLDRKDSLGHYEPGNCRWVTQAIQQNNRGNNRRLTFGGKTMTLMEWSRETGLPREVIAKRLDLLGWPIEEALTKPSDRESGRFKPGEDPRNGVRFR